MVPFGSVPLPIVGIMGLVGAEAINGFSPVAVGCNGVRPAIGVRVESPGFAMERGVNMERFPPGIMGKVDTEPIPYAGL